MNSKRKLLISMLAIVFVLLAVVATVAIAFALTQQTITTTLNIGYVVEDIDGTASATYTIGGVTESLTAKKGNQVIGDTLVFHAGDTEDAGNLMFPEGQIPLSAQNDNIVIQYTYSNTGAKHYIASMSFDGNISADNMKVEYSIDGTTYSENRYAVVVPANTANKSYWIKISIDNKAKSASFTGDFRWLLSGCDEQEDSYLSLTNLEFKSRTDMFGNGAYAASIAGEGSYVGELVFPSEINNDPVTIITQGSLTQAQKNQITSVYIPDSVTRICGESFKTFQNLQTVTFEQNETTGASVASSTGLTYIEYGAFQNCSSLREIKLPNTVTTLESGMFAGCTSLTSVVIPNNITTIEAGTFSGCTGLVSATIGTGISSVPFAFLENCSGLKNVAIPNNITSIEGYSFYGCTSLTQIEIPASVTSVDSDAFTGCINLKNITTNTLNSSVVTTIKNLANANGEMNLTIDTVTEIPTGLFSGCTGLTSVTIGNSVTKIQSYAFDHCTGLKSVNIGSGLKYIYDGAFSCCSGLTEITIPNNVTNISPLAFSSCDKLTSAIFENKTGWVVNDITWTMGGISKNLTAEELNDSANAATLLRSTYYSWEWVRS